MEKPRVYSAGSIQTLQKLAASVKYHSASALRGHNDNDVQAHNCTI